MINNYNIVTITDSAAIHIKNIMNTNNVTSKLRLFILGGGCSGFQYDFMLDHYQDEDDWVLKNNNTTIIIDSMSYPYFMGAILDFEETIDSSKFIIRNLNNVKKTCSCGKSFVIND
jgi:iron-sulfur cluster insertion protein